MKKIFLIIVLGQFSFQLLSQEFIKTERVYSQKNSFEFTNEWQYVSTDLYLMNSNKFNYLINILNPKKKKIFSQNKNEEIKNILVTSKLQGLGDLDKITYPLFNFIVNKDDKGKYKIQTSDPEVIRIVDNVPVSSINDYLGAEIKVQIFSDKNKKEIYNFISTQLDIVSSLASANTSAAALKVVGEVSNLMKKNAAGKQYEFSSTIRFYEEQDFDRNIHSISIYTFQPSFYLNSGFDTTKLSVFMDTLKVGIMTKEKIKELINYNMFPYIVAINYRSKYKPQISDDVDFQMLKQRDSKNEADYKTNKISREIYLQEKNLIEFLFVYAQLKLDITNYELNYKAKITEDYTIQLFLILQDFWELKNTFDITEKSNIDNPLFQNQFKPLYNRYLTKANIMFETNSSLRAIREHAKTITYLEMNGITALDSNLTENYLRKLKAVKIPKRENFSDEAIITKHWISILENNHLKKYFLPKINEFKLLPVITPTYEQVSKFRLSSSNTYCELCKIGVDNFVDGFMKNYNEYLFNTSQKSLTRKLAESRTNIFKYSKKQSCIENNIENKYSDNSLPDYILLYKKTLIQISKQRDELYLLVNEQNNFVNADEINQYLTKIQKLEYQIETNFNSICNSSISLCDCNNNQDKKDVDVDNDNNSNERYKSEENN